MCMCWIVSTFDTSSEIIAIWSSPLLTLEMPKYYSTPIRTQFMNTQNHTHSLLWASIIKNIFLSPMILFIVSLNKFVPFLNYLPWRNFSVDNKDIPWNLMYYRRELGDKNDGNCGWFEISSEVWMWKNGFLLIFWRLFWGMKWTVSVLKPESNLDERKKMGFFQLKTEELLQNEP